MIRLRPNRHTIALGAMLVTMWYASSAQQNGGAFVLTFLTLALAMVSLLHAWTNLRAVEIQAGVIPAVQEGEMVRVPLALSVGKGRVPCGLEVTASSAVEPVFIETLTPGQPTRIELKLRPSHHGKSEKIKIVVRSYYPLGFFTTTRMVEVAQSRMVLPKPEGTIPLPPATQGTATNLQSRPAKNQGDGEDFAGVREWVPGDSLRHVDWKAVARERPMMVKLWSGSPPSVVWLNWDSLNLPEDERTRQIAQWVVLAEQEGLAYGMRLHGVVISPDYGPVHQRRCMEALATHGEGIGTSAPSVVTSHDVPPAPHEATAEVPGMPLTMMLSAMVLSVLPVLTSVPAAGPLALLVGLLFRWRMKQPVAIGWRLVPAFIAVFGTWWQLGTLKGLEAGVAVLLGMTAAKLIEARTPRDMQLLSLLGWFLCLCSLSIDQAIGHSLWAYAMFLMIAIALVRFRRGSAGMKSPLRVCFTMLGQAVPFVVLLFFLFPRDSLGIAQRLNRALVNRTGMSDKLDPGSVASIARSQEVAFRASFDDNAQTPPVNTRYWRCIVMTQCNGMHWERGGSLSDQPRRPTPPNQLVDQIITLSPHGGRWLPAYDRPARVRSQNEEHLISPDEDTLQSLTEVTSVRRYKVASSLDTAYHPLKLDHRAANLQVPRQVPQRVRDLAVTLSADSDTPEATVQKALEWFRGHGFQYTLEPGTYDKGQELEQFLFDRKLGFCEHYAASFGLLMRLAKVPTRIVIGYLGGEFNSSGYYTIRQSDAHAWAEVWIEGKGWQRVDPTAVLAPQRVTADLRSMLEAGAEGVFGAARNTWLGRSLDGVRQAWDHANYLWYERVVQFDEQEQFDLWMRLGLMRMPVHILASGVIFLFGLPLLAIWFWLRRSARHPDPAARLWLSFCGGLAKAGVRRESNEGPLAFARRASAKLPDKAKTIERVAQLYLSTRYGDHSSALAEMKQAIREA